MATAKNKNRVGNVEIFKSTGDQSPLRRIKKMSAQTQEDTQSIQMKYVEPRFSFEDLMYFFEINTWHQRAIRLKAATAVGLGYDIIGSDGKAIDSEKEPNDKTYKSFKALLEKPNNEYRFSKLAVRQVIDYLGTGNTFMEIAMNNAGEPGELFHARVKNMRTGYDGLHCYQLINGAIKQTFWNFGIDPSKKPSGDKSVNQMIHYKNYDPRSDYYGLPEWQPAMIAALLDRSAAEFNIRMFENDLMLKWIFWLIGADLSAGAKKTLKSFFENNYTGIKNAGRAAFVPIEDGENVKIEAKNLMGDGPSRDMSYAKLREQARDEMISAHGVPPRLMGIMAAGQLGGGGELEGQLKMFKETVVVPLKEDMEEMFNAIPIKMEWPYRIRFREFDITTSKEDRSFWSAIPGLVMAGVLTSDEGRELMQLQQEIIKSKKTAVTVPEIGFGAANLVAEIIKLRKAIATAEAAESAEEK